MQDYKDGSGLQFIKFDFTTGGQKIKTAILVKSGSTDAQGNETNEMILRFKDVRLEVTLEF